MLDEGALATLLASLGDHGREVIELWLSGLDERVEAIRSAARAGNTPGLAIAAHTLRGSAMYVGAARLVDSCAEIERQLHAGRAADAIDSVIYRVQRDAAAAADALRASAVMRAPNG